MIRLRSKAQLLLALLLIGGAWMPLLTFAPNRLLSGQGIYLSTLLQGMRLWWLLPAIALLVAPWLRATTFGHLIRLMAGMLLSNGLLWLAGQEATWRAGDEEAVARVSFGAGFWLLQLAIGLSLAENLRGLRLAHLPRSIMIALLSLPGILLLISGVLDNLSLLKEYRNYQESFDLALIRHLQLVLFSLLPALLVGTASGVAAFRSSRLASLIFPVLNVIQTIPSIALFGLLIGPLVWLSQRFPTAGLSGIGMPPALVALTLYALLPLTRGTLAALQQVPVAVRETARGIGMSSWQMFIHVELPLALPVFLTAVRITTVQSIGLAAVAALIGAGGLGAIMFQGISASATDQVLLGVIPMVLFATMVDATFKSIIMLLKKEYY